MSNLETWVTTAVSAASNVAFSIPVVGQILGPLGFAANALLQLFWPQPQVNLMEQALSDAESALSLPTNVDLGTWRDLLNTLTEETSQAQQAATQAAANSVVSLYYQLLSTAIDPGDAGKISAQLTTLANTVMNNAQDPWRQRFQILSIYVAGASIELQVMTQLTRFSSLVDPGSESALAGNLIQRAQFHSSQATAAMTQINTAVLAEMQQTAGDAYPVFMLPPAPTDPQSEAQVLATSIGLHAQLVPGQPLISTVSTDIQTAINGLADVQQVSGQWNILTTLWATVASGTVSQSAGA